MRREKGKPLNKWMLDEKLKDEGMEGWVEAMGLVPNLKVKGWEETERVEWVKGEEEEEGEEDEEEYEEGDDDDDEAEEEEEE